VALCEAVYDGEAAVEDVRCRRINTPAETGACHSEGIVPLLADPAGETLSALRPAAVIDVILAKRNLGTHPGMAPVVIGLGPGFTAGQDVHAVIETMRGHNLGRILWQGSALPNTGTPGEMGGQSALRVLHAPCAGVVVHTHAIGDVVRQGEAICTIEGAPVTAPFTGLLRGLIRQGLSVPRGMKIADIDPRLDVDWHTISDKARCLGGSALTAYLHLAG
jgi:xanthine dehydrogenase accessory factor